MAINRVDYPANLTAQADFSAHGELIETRYMDQSSIPLQVVGGEIPQGVVFQIGGVVYQGDTATAITGTASDYVKITPAGATAAAAYVANLTGVTWSAQYAGYYDASSNLYVFDEGKALAAGQIATVFGRYLMQQATGDVQIGRDIAVQRNAAITGNATVTGTLGVTGATTLADTLGVTGNTTVGGTLGVTGALSSATLSTGKVTPTAGVVPTNSYRATSVDSVAIATALLASLPTNGNEMLVTGSVLDGSTTLMIHRAVRLSGTEVRLDGMSTAGSLDSLTTNTADTVTTNNYAISW